MFKSFVKSGKSRARFSLTSIVKVLSRIKIFKIISSLTVYTQIYQELDKYGNKKKNNKKTVKRMVKKNVERKKSETFRKCKVLNGSRNLTEIELTN